MLLLTAKYFWPMLPVGEYAESIFMIVLSFISCSRLHSLLQYLDRSVPGRMLLRPAGHDSACPLEKPHKRAGLLTLDCTKSAEFANVASGDKFSPA